MSTYVYRRTICDRFSWDKWDLTVSLDAYVGKIEIEDCDLQYDQ